MISLFKVEIYYGNEFVGNGEFIKEGSNTFSLVSNCCLFDGHKNTVTKEYKYIWSFCTYDEIKTYNFDEIMNYLREQDRLSRNTSFGGKYPEFYLIKEKTKTKFNEIEL